VKWLGDGVIFDFREPTGAVVAALEMVDAISAAGLPPAHVGLDTGPSCSREATPADPPRLAARAWLWLDDGPAL
jgi:tagatose-1,6-bisphosphate aldolase non-catalytic subunit AgaZ/GatZ